MTTLALRRVFRLVNGGTPISDEGNWGGEVQWATPVDLARHNGGRIASTDRTLTPKGLASGSRAVRAGSLIVSTRAPIGYVAETAAAMAFNQGCRGLEPKLPVDIRYFRYQLGSMAEQLQSRGNGSTFVELSSDALAEAPVVVPPLDKQRAIADYLDAETARIDALIAKKQQLIHLLEERIDAAITEVVGQSEIVTAGGEPSVEIRRVLEKLDRSPAVEEMITAFRDGQVTTRAARGKEGFTNSWTDNARVQGVRIGDVVVHGLDGFSGAIGDSEGDGVCSPVYHVCRPRDGGDPAFYGRLLRRLALTGYLGNFAVSTRERAVDFRNWDLFGRIPIPHVGVEQQREIGDRIRALRPVVALVERSEVLANERKAALITRVMTGELIVPGAA